jgi:hypothetical protein
VENELCICINIIVLAGAELKFMNAEALTPELGLELELEFPSHIEALQLEGFPNFQ